MQSFIIYILYMIYVLTSGQYLYYQLLKPKTDHILLIGIILHILFVVLYLLLQKHLYLATYLLYIFMFLPSLFYEGDMKHKLTLTFMSLTFTITSEIIFAIVFVAISPLFPHINMVPVLFKTNNQYILISIFSLLTGSFILLLTVKAASLLKNSFTVLKSGLILRTCFYFVAVIIINNLYAAPSAIKLSLFLVLISIIATIFLIILLNRLFKEISKSSHDIALKQQQVELVESQLTSYKETEAQYIEIRHWNHDIANHILSLAHLIESSKNEEAKEYIRNIIEEEKQ